MSKVIAKLLDKSEKEVAKAVSALEKATGYPSEDIRHHIEAKNSLRSKVASLGLDPVDTTNRELYHAALNRFEEDSKNFNQSIGISDSANFEQRITTLHSRLHEYFQDFEMVGLTRTAAKQVIRQNPPKRMMKLLNYRSVESLLKREKIEEIFLACQYIETSSWKKTNSKILSAVPSSSYRLTKLSLVFLAPTRYGRLSGPENGIAESAWIAAVGVWPSMRNKKASALALSLIVIKAASLLHPKIDLKDAPKLDPTLHWWADSHHIIATDKEGTASLNMHDVAFNHLNGHEYGSSAAHHGRQAFWDELMNRYTQASQELKEGLLFGFSDIKLQPKMPMSELAAEYAEAES